MNHHYQVDLLLQLAPNTKTIGIIYTSSEVNSQIQVDEVKAYAKELNIDLEKAEFLLAKWEKQLDLIYQRDRRHLSWKNCWNC